MISESSIRESLENFRERYFSNYTLVKFPVLFPLSVFAKYLSEVHTFQIFRYFEKSDRFSLNSDFRSLIRNISQKHQVETSFSLRLTFQ